MISKAKIKELFSSLLKLNTTPQEIALGVSIGVMIAIMPLYGFHTLLCVLFAFLIPRANKIAILVGTNISLPPTLPVITWAGYSIGRIILGNQYPPLNFSTLKTITLQNIHNLYYPLFIGSLLLGTFLAVIFYFLTFWSIQRYRKLKIKHLVLVIIFMLNFWSITIVLADKYDGEKIIYSISPMGHAEYSNLGDVDIQGKKYDSFVFKTQALGLNDTEKIYLDKLTHLPIRVERNVSMWLHKEYILEKYDQERFCLTIDKFIKNKKINQYVFQKEGPIWNAILLPFYLRTVDTLDIGWNIKVRVPEEFTIRLDSFDEVKVPAGKFMTYHFTSVPNKFEIWISKDALRLPIKIKGLSGIGYMLVMKSHFLPPKQDKEIKSNVSYIN